MNKTQKIQALAYETAYHFFVIMLNPKYRGSNFRFSTFDIEDLAESQGAMSFAMPLKNDEKAHLRFCAKSKWKELIKKSNVESWIVY